MNALSEKIRALIEATGPMPVSDFMALALGDPEHGYYTTREPFGAAGDFTTAPEISQMFGELIGIWSIAVFEALGRPERFVLAELGPGRGTLMADALRAARIRPAFTAGAEVHLVETSPRLRALQAEALAGLAEPVWHDRVEDLPAGPAIVIANEFFDALPIRQLVRTEAGWRERMIGLGDDGRLVFGAGASGIDPILVPDHARRAPVGTVVEIAPAAAAVMGELAERVVRHGGIVLAIDYGSAVPGTGDTLQALHRHASVDVLENPGEADVTAHVDFAELAMVAREFGATVHGPVEQGDFLVALGLVERAGTLGRDKDEATRADLVTAVERLAAPEQMGRLFKAMAVSSGIRVPGFGRSG
ncbi:class I SAM-dependent methyltransferase [Chthonobacter albigriseus]|uniref:class I SAM-dependent methyltransferase n=1 Tax=Chthonobacter albigriseus TaxID=1683161 RepID=UPI0015EFC3BE|nr:class I SAM-dependent methyltransferase [Chthonobacter albigriseus]